MLVEPVSVEEVYPLRLLVLRPGGTLNDCKFEGDLLQTTVHFAAFDGLHEVCAVASFYEKGHPEVFASQPVQLRGMASHPNVRGKGYGKAIVVHAMAHYRRQGKDVMWCNAREVAVGFYQQLGFVTMGEPFDIANIGKHWVMKVAL